MRDAWRDLVLGSSCLGCGRPGRLLCRDCSAALPDRGAVAWPTPTPPGLALPMAGGEYDGLLKALVNGHKERGLFALATPLGRVLAAVVRDLAAEVGGAGPLVLVPVPSRPGVVRQRGHDPLLRVSRHAARRLRGEVGAAQVRRLLAPRGRVRDQAGLTATERSANLAGSLTCRSGPRPVGTVVIVDDVITTGSTAREAQRALEAVGVEVRGVAAVAATRRRAAPDSSVSLPVFPPGD